MKVREVVLKGFHIISGLVLIVCLLWAAFWLFVPLSRSKDQVADYVERTVPYGTSWEDALDILDHSRYTDYYAYEDAGLCMNAYSGQVWVGIADEPHLAQLGDRTIKVTLGHYNGPLDTYVIAYLAFDDKKLTYIAIKKDVDGL